MTDHRIAYLASDAYGGRGGIALYNRDVLQALSESDGGERPVVFPRIAGNGSDAVPDAVDWRPMRSRSVAEYLARAAWFAARAQNLDLIYCAHINLLPAAAMMKRLTGSPILLAIYGIDAWQPHPSARTNRAIQQVDHCLSISDFTLRQFLAWSAFPLEHTSIVPNAVHLDRFGEAPRRADLVRKFALDDAKVIMLTGRMDASERRKGFDELISAFPAILEKCPNAMLMLVGDGDDLPRMKAKCAGLGIAARVRFPGFVPESEKADYFRLADAYVMPSTQEGFGFVHLEAMACGVPTVASAVDGAREAVRDGLIGRLVDPADQESLIAQTLAALDTPRGIPDGLSHFAFDAFRDRLNACVEVAITKRAKPR